MDRDTMRGLSAAVEEFAGAIAKLGPDTIFQCSASTDEEDAMVLSFWGTGNDTPLRLESFEDLVGAVMVHMAKAAGWKKEEVAAELMRIAMRVYRLTFTPGEDTRPEELARIETEAPV